MCLCCYSYDQLATISERLTSVGNGTAAPTTAASPSCASTTSLPAPRWQVIRLRNQTLPDHHFNTTATYQLKPKTELVSEAATPNEVCVL
jgi:hypothetical protein